MGRKTIDNGSEEKGFLVKLVVKQHCNGIETTNEIEKKNDME